MLGKKITSGIAFIIFSIWLFIGFKSCFGTIWKSPESIKTYTTYYESGYQYSYAFLKDNKAASIFIDHKNETYEANLFEIYGEYSDYIFFNIWNTSIDGNLTGLRYYPDGQSPVNMRLKVLEKLYTENYTPKFLADKNTRLNKLFIISEDSIRIDNMWFWRDYSYDSIMSDMFYLY